MRDLMCSKNVSIVIVFDDSVWVDLEMQDERQFDLRCE